MIHHLKVEDFDTWKAYFDEDPVGRKQAAKGHSMLRSARSRTRPRSGIVSSLPARSPRPRC